jgi:hypothetical protein
MSRTEATRRVGEVIETSTVKLWAESDQLNELPPLGSVVQVGTAAEDVVFAVVSFGQTTGVDATRRAVRRGSSDLQDDEVYRRHPELSQILRTTFEAVPVAYRRGQRIIRTVPPLPPPLHYSVSSVTVDDLCALTDDLRYLTLLSQYQGAVAPEQLVIAHIRAVFAARGGDLDWIEHAAAEISRIYKLDYERLLPILESIDPTA